MGWLHVLAAAALATGAHAAPATGSVICVEGPQWRPPVEDSAQIEQHPVPPSYSAMFESANPCVRWSMGDEELLPWLLHFGSAHSADAGLAYLAKGYSRGLPAPAAFPAAVRAAYRAALPDLTRGASSKQPVYDRDAVQRLHGLAYAGDRYKALAEMYLAAAEEFQDLHLLDEANVYLPVAYETDSFLDSVEQTAPAKGQMYFNRRLQDYPDLKARSLLLRAAITHAPGDLAAAGKVVSAMEKPLYSRAVTLAFQYKTTPCEPPAEEGDAAGIRSACKDDDDFEQGAIDYTTNRAILDALETRPAERHPYPYGEPDAFDLTMGLIKNGQFSEDQTLNTTLRQSELSWRLLTYRSIASMRALRAHPTLANLKYDAFDAVVEDWQEALADLTALANAAPPYEAPGRFERVARQWLDVWRMRTSITAEDAQRNYGGYEPADQRFAAYLTVTLANLDAIRKGDGKPE